MIAAVSSSGRRVWRRSGMPARTRGTRRSTLAYPDDLVEVEAHVEQPEGGDDLGEQLVRRLRVVGLGGLEVEEQPPAERPRVLVIVLVPRRRRCRRRARRRRRAHRARLVQEEAQDRDADAEHEVAGSARPAARWRAGDRVGGGVVVWSVTALSPMLAHRLGQADDRDSRVSAPPCRFDGDRPSPMPSSPAARQEPPWRAAKEGDNAGRPTSRFADPAGSRCATTRSDLGALHRFSPHACSVHARGLRSR